MAVSLLAAHFPGPSIVVATSGFEIMIYYFCISPMVGGELLIGGLPVGGQRYTTRDPFSKPKGNAS